MLGFLNLNKPSGLTSHDCVARVRRGLRMKRVGHGGTLDPQATGVLPMAVGKATRLLSFLPAGKAYQARIRFGVQTTTDDLAGQIIETRRASHLNLEVIVAQLERFVGEIEQVPPAYSAIQRGGKRLYELARAGETVEVPKRIVSVSQIEVLGWYPGEFPELEVKIACGPGTYIRAIARDLGAVLNTGGTLAALTRTLSGGFQLADSLTLEALETQLQQQALELIPPAIALQHLDQIVLPAAQAKRWCQGQSIPVKDQTPFSPPAPVRVHGSNKHLLGIGELMNAQAQLLLTPKVVLETQ